MPQTTWTEFMEISTIVACKASTTVFPTPTRKNRKIAKRKQNGHNSATGLMSLKITLKLIQTTPKCRNFYPHKILKCNSKYSRISIDEMNKKRIIVSGRCWRRLIISSALLFAQIKPIAALLVNFWNTFVMSAPKPPILSLHCQLLRLRRVFLLCPSPNSMKKLTFLSQFIALPQIINFLFNLSA